MAVHVRADLYLLLLTVASMCAALSSSSVSNAVMFVEDTGSCNTDVDCSLNGKCVGGSCQCYPPWTGAMCGSMAFLPAKNHGAYGVTPNVTSWGGNMVFYDGKYHLFVAEMVGDCGLHTWTTNSQVAHAVADTVDGPYTKVDVSLLPWAHNPQVVLVNDTQDAPMFVLFHIGAGDNTSSTVKCPPTPSEQDLDFKRTSLFTEQQQSAWGQTFHTASNPAGPWTSHSLPFGCNNPSPLYHGKNWYLLCNGGGWTLYNATSLNGPWNVQAKLPHNPPNTGNWEDPFIFIDKRGNWHALAHAYNNTKPCGPCDSALVSGHLYSQDGIQWYANAVQPYTHQVKFTDGTSHIFSTRERPKLYFDPTTGEPTHLVSGVNPMSTCPPQPSVDCKTTAGIDYDFTLVQPLDLSSQQ